MEKIFKPKKFLMVFTIDKLFFLFNYTSSIATEGAGNQGVKKRCRLSWRTISDPVYEPLGGGEGGGVRGLSQ